MADNSIIVTKIIVQITSEKQFIYSEKKGNKNSMSVAVQIITNNYCGLNCSLLLGYIRYVIVGNKRSNFALKIMPLSITTIMLGRFDLMIKSL